MAQLAELFLRGAVTKAMRELTEEQRLELEDIVQEISSDPMFSSAKRQFCLALKNTISNEYADEQVGEVDFNIAVLKAAMAAKYGWGSYQPNPKIFECQIQKKKWFQTWVFSYLRQILLENKIPGYSHTVKTKLPANEAAIIEIKNFLYKAKTSIHYKQDKKNISSVIKSIRAEEKDGCFVMYLDQWFLPASIIHELCKISKKYLKHDVNITYHSDRIVIKPNSFLIGDVEVNDKRNVKIKFSNFETSEDDTTRRYHLEFEVSGLNDNEPQIDSDQIIKLKQQLPDDAVQILELLIDPPEDYINKHGTRFYKSHIAKYLGTTPRQVEKMMYRIRLAAMSLGIIIS